MNQAQLIDKCKNAIKDWNDHNDPDNIVVFHLKNEIEALFVVAYMREHAKMRVAIILSPPPAINN